MLQPKNPHQVELPDSIKGSPLGEVIQAVSPSHVQLTPDEIEHLAELDISLTAEFIDIARTLGDIRGAVYQLYDGIDPESPLRKRFTEQDDPSLPRYEDKKFLENGRPVSVYLRTRAGRELLNKARIRYEQSAIPQLVAPDCVFESGGLKSTLSLLDNERREGGEDETERLPVRLRIRDAVRGRITGQNLLDVESALERFQKSGERVVAVRNSFRNPDAAFNGRPHNACNVTVAIPPEVSGLPPEHGITYEWQFKTQGSATVDRLTHPVFVRRYVELPEHLSDYLRGLAFGQALFEARDYLARKSHGN